MHSCWNAIIGSHRLFWLKPGFTTVLLIFVGPAGGSIFRLRFYFSNSGSILLIFKWLYFIDPIRGLGMKWTGGCPAGTSRATHHRSASWPNSSQAAINFCGAEDSSNQEKSEERSEAENVWRNQTPRPDTNRTNPPIPAERESAQASAKASHDRSGARARVKVGASPERHDCHIRRVSRDSDESLRSQSGGMRTEIQGKASGTSERLAGLRRPTETRVQPLGQLQRPTSRWRQRSLDRADRNEDTATWTSGGSA